MKKRVILTAATMERSATAWQPPMLASLASVEL